MIIGYNNQSCNPEALSCQTISLIGVYMVHISISSLGICEVDELLGIGGVGIVPADLTASRGPVDDLPFTCPKQISSNVTT
jgi:hypothetical protein